MFCGGMGWQINIVQQTRVNSEAFIYRSECPKSLCEMHTTDDIILVEYPQQGPKRHVSRCQCSEDMGLFRRALRPTCSKYL